MLTRILLLSLLLAAPALALEPYLVKDIDTFSEPGHSTPRSFAAMGGVAFFSADDGLSGHELWRSDGTSGGTWQVAEFCVLEGCSGHPLGFAVTDRLYFFTAQEDRSGRRTLWVTDGTSGGTVRLGVAVQGTPLWLPAQGVLYFSGSDREHGSELWRTDGTPAGTYMISDLLPGAIGSAPRDLTLYKGRIYFGAVSPNGGALWRSDGTARGTVVVKELRKRNTSALDERLRPFSLHVLGKRLVFAADAGVGHHDLWASDGTGKGTARLTQWTRGTAYSRVHHVVAVGSRSYVVADDGRKGQELWVTDGTAKGTKALTAFSRADAFFLDFLVEPFMLLADALTAGRFVFAADDGPHGLELWSTDGTAKGTRLVADVCPGECNGFGRVWMTHRGLLFFAGNDGARGWEMWATDGTAAGTRLLRDVCPGGCDGTTGRLPVLLGDRLIFPADDGGHVQLWSTDGTGPGTIPVTGFASRYAVDPFQAVVLGTRLLFAADDGVHGNELWGTDGTAEGTSLVRNIHNVDLGGSEPVGLRFLDGTAFFLADDGIHGYELWKSDGTEAGTELVAELVPGEQPAGQPVLRASDTAGGKLFFIKDRLWVTDGTEAGTLALTGPQVAVCCYDQIRAAGGKVFFPAFESEYALWVSDGTVAGTHPLGDIGNASVLDMVEFQGRLYFTLESGELWVSDGTDAGTVRVEELGALPRSGVFQVTPWLTVHAGSLWYFASDGEGGVELRRGNGTGPGTPLIAGLEPLFVTPFGAKLLVSEIDGLWITDGTPAGTVLLGPPLSMFDGVSTVHQGHFYYAMYDPSRNRSFLWTTDGTPEGTEPLLDREGSEIRAARDFAPLGSRLLFVDEDRSLWQTDGTAAGTFAFWDLERSSGELVSIGSRVLFPSYDPATGVELWAVEEP